MTRSPTPDPGRPAASPGVLPLAATRPACLRQALEALVLRQAAAHPEVEVSLDVAAGQGHVADPLVVDSLLGPLVAAAFAVAAGPRGSGDGPPLREVDVAVIATTGGLEVEIADSGPDRLPEECIRPTVHRSAARCRAEVLAVACPTGGMAVTVRLPRRDALRRAA